MEETDVKKLWQLYDNKLEKSLTLNHKIIREIQSQKAENSINSFRKTQVLGILAGILWIVFLGFLVLNSLDKIYFAISAGAILLFNVYAVVAYIWTVVIINGINIAGNITETQQKLTLLQNSFTKIGRVLILQAPFYCTFWYTDELVAHGGTTFWLIQLLVVSFFTGISIYLYRQLTPENNHKKWVRAIGDSKLRKAIEFLNEIEEFKKGS